ncbi:MAG: hypothetical protein Alis3KO_40960 [Aliiglaciecola sp.]
MHSVGQVGVCNTLSDDMKHRVEAALHEYRDCFATELEDLSVTPSTQFHIELKEGSKARRSGRLRRFAPAKMDFIRNHCDALQRAGIIQATDHHD